VETIVVLQSKEDIHSQQMGENFSFVIPGFSGSGNDLRIVLSLEAQQELLKDIAGVNKAKAIESAQRPPDN
jgi:hypothetical protein